MKLLATLLASLALTGCASNCSHACLFGFGPGNSVFNTVADAADRDDACQTNTHSRLTGERLKPDGYEAPWFCKERGRNKSYRVYDRSGRFVGSVRP